MSCSLATNAMQEPNRSGPYCREDPQLLRKGAAAVIDRTPAWVWSSAGRASGAYGGARFATRAGRLAEALRNTSALSLYRSICSLWSAPNAVVLGGQEAEVEAWGAGFVPTVATPALFQLVDLQTYLPDAILAKVDRASMAVGLKSRRATSQSQADRARAAPAPARTRTRWSDEVGPCGSSCYRRVPRALVDRPKQGFGVPMAAWLRGPLREWADDLLARNSLALGGLLQPEPILERWNAHRSGSADWSYSLWAVLVFLDWHRRWQSQMSPGSVGAAL